VRLFLFFRRKLPEYAASVTKGFIMFAIRFFLENLVDMKHFFIVLLFAVFFMYSGYKKALTPIVYKV